LTDAGQKNVAEPSDSRDSIRDVRTVQLRGEVDSALGISGAAIVGDFLVIGADEGHRLQLLKRTADETAWKLKHNVDLTRDGREIDIEAVTYGDGYVYVVGSHSFRRRRLKRELSVRKNRERMLTVEAQPSRNRLFRVAFDAKSGSIGKIDSIDLSKRLLKDPLLHLFVGLPSKENGIDIEGIAYRERLLHLGFRGPVLRGNYVPVMVLDFKHPKRYTLRFVCLGGQGIRDFVAVDNGFLIVSGPANDAPGPYRLWWWDGECQIPGHDQTVRQTCLLGEIGASGGAKAEGLTVISSEGDVVEALVVYETDTASQAVRMRVTLPR
jgi:hypothetical protein